MNSEDIPLYDISPGKLLGGRYRVVRAHRKGGLSIAFEVNDEHSGERCELQLFATTLFEQPEQVKEVKKIIEPWERVACDSVLRVRDVTLIGTSTVAVVTDFPTGQSLRSRLETRGHFTGAEVVTVGTQILEGLVEIHSQSLVHGDIKPSTVYVQGEKDDLQVTLVDGGVTPALWTAKDLGDKTALIGTPHYAPVEQFGGDSPNAHSDIYNCAAVLFECATGVLPWKGSTFVEVFQAKLDRSPPSMRRRAPEIEVDPELERVIVTGCLADRKERYASAEHFLRELSDLGDLGDLGDL